MSQTLSELKTTVDRSTTERVWARDILAGAEVSQRELARAWGVHDSYVSRWLDGTGSNDISLSSAATFCRITSTNFDELLAHMGLEPISGTGPSVLHRLAGPPIPTIKISPGPVPGSWYLLAHIKVSTEALSGIARAFDEAAADARLSRKRKVVAEAKLADFG